MSSIGETVFRHRAQKVVTQEELARLIGTRQSAISRIENNKLIPSIKALSKIANALGLNLVIDFEKR